MIAGSNTFSSLLSEHEELEALFDKHQRALLMRDIGAAVATIATFDNALQRHIAYEDEVLLPLYAAKKAETEGATLPIFHAEHRKLRETAANLATRTRDLYESGDLLASILRLLDDEALFKGLFCHHAMREKNLFFPRLDACTTDFEKQRVFGVMLNAPRRGARKLAGTPSG
jgi:hemerythrin-like domain-containing protein